MEENEVIERNNKESNHMSKKEFALITAPLMMEMEVINSKLDESITTSTNLPASQESLA